MKHRWFVVVSVQACFTYILGGGSNRFMLYPQVPLVLMVIGAIVTMIFVTVILFLIEFESQTTVSVSLHTFFTCCEPSPRQSLDFPV